MKEKYNKPMEQSSDANRPVDGALVTIDLPMFKRQIKEELFWKGSKRNSITIFKTNGLHIVLIALHKGAEMARHVADGIISVQVLEGCVQFNTDGKSVELNNGQILALHEGIPHSILALEEAIFLLTRTTSLV